ncbi:MAG: dTDP-4-dehydrorhamnose 3,5-epimerase [Saprospiraceae bacterium]
MGFLQTGIDGLLLFEPRVFYDERGYFFEAFNRKVWEEAGVQAEFVQDNQAFSTRGVLRGLHYQCGPAAQAKLVRVLAGEVFDVAVDLRPDSSTYGRWYGVILSAENKRQLYVPRGFAHGYLALSETAEFFYKCDNYYDKGAEGGLYFDDPKVGIEWPFDLNRVLVAEKDRILPRFGQHKPAVVS